MKFITPLFLVILAVASVNAQQVIFDTTVGAELLTLGANDGDEFADDASFASAGRTVTDIEISVLAQAFGGGSLVSDVTASLYDMSGPGGSPGALLWSDTQTGVSFASLSNTVSFSGLSTVVPQDVFWSVKFDNLVLGEFDLFGPQIGVAANLQPSGASTDEASYFYKISPSVDFSESFIISADSTFAVKITAENAVPEPSSAILVLVGSAMLLIRCRTHHR